MAVIEGNSPLSGPDSLQFLPVILQYFQQKLLCSNLLQIFVLVWFFETGLLCVKALPVPELAL